MEMPYTCEVQLSFCNCTLSVLCGFIDKKRQVWWSFLSNGSPRPLGVNQIHKFMATIIQNTQLRHFTENADRKLVFNLNS